MKNKANILVFKFSLVLGGGERFNLVLGQGLKNKGHRIKFFSNYKPLVKRLRESGIKSKKMYWGKEMGARRNIVEYTILWLPNKIRFFLILFFNKKYKTKNIVILQSLHEKILATSMARFLGYNVFWVEHLSIRPWLTNSRFRGSYVKKVDSVNKIIVISKLIKKELVEEFRIKDKKIEVIYHGIDLKKFYPLEERLIEAKKKEFGFYKESKIVGYVGRLHKEKGLDILIRSFSQLAKRFAPIYLLLIGEGPNRKELELLVKKLDLEKNVFFLGYRDDVSTLVNMMDVFVLPSKVRESFGIVLIEAMAAGKITIGSNLGGIPEIINNKKNGFLFEPGDEKQLTDYISRVLSDNELRRKIEGNAIRTVREKFSEEVMIKNLERTLTK